MKIPSENRQPGRDPSLFGKDQILDKILLSMNDAVAGKGSFILLEGEAGIGKTYLIDRIGKEASLRGFNVMRGGCLDYRREPYLPFKYMLTGYFNITTMETYEKNKERVIGELNRLTLRDDEFQEDFSDIFIPKDQLLGGFRIKGDRLEKLISYLERSGYRIIYLTDNEESIYDGHYRSIDVINIQDEKEDAIPPSRLERIATTLKGSFNRYRHCAVINDAMSSLGNKNPERKVSSFIKIINRLARESDSIIIHMDRGGTGQLLHDISEIEDRIKDDNNEGRTKADIKMSKNEILTGFMTRLSEESPLLVILEDLQWGDKHSLNLLQLMARDISGEKMIIIGSYRPEESVIEDEIIEIAPLREALQRMSRERLFQKFVLERLDLQQQRSLVEYLTEHEIEDELIERINERTKGNPLFIKQFLMDLGERNVEDNAELTDMGSNEDNSISPRILRLDEGSKMILEFASVLGERSNLKMIINGLGIDEEEALDRLDRLLDLKLINEVGEVLIFEHPKWRDMVYEGIDDENRSFFHLRAARQIETDPHQKEDHKLSLLGDHYFKGGDHEKAYRAFFKAAGIELERMNTERSHEYLQKALWSLDRLPRTKDHLFHRVKTLQIMGDLKKQNGDYRESLVCFKKAVDIAEKGKIPHGISSSYRRIADIMLNLYEWDQTVDYYLRSLHLSKKEDDQEEISKAFKGLGTIYYLKGDYPRSMDCYMKYLEFPDMERMTINTRAFIEIGDIYHEMGDFNQALTYYNLAISQGEESDLTYESALSYIKKANLLMKLGKVNDATRFGTWGFNMVKDHHGTEDSERVILGYIELMMESSDIEKADQACNLIGERSEGRINNLLLKAYRLRTLGLLAAKKRDFKKAGKNLKEALEIHSSLNIPFQIGLTKLQYGLIFFQEMKLEQAMKMLEEASMTFQSVNAVYYLNRTASKLKELKFIIKGFKS